jgi:NADH-quinone oxidoreductase subunit C
MTQGLQVLPELKPKRYSVSYHLLALRQGAPRARLQCWVDEGQHVPSVVSVWPTCDWLEREQYDLMGVQFTGHPDLRRIMMPDDWVGNPLRKDYAEQAQWHNITTTRDNSLEGYVRLDELKKKAAEAAAASKKELPQ